MVCGATTSLAGRAGLFERDPSLLAISGNQTRANFVPRVAEEEGARALAPRRPLGDPILDRGLDLVPVINCELVIFPLQRVMQPFKTLADFPHRLIEPAHLLLEKSEARLVVLCAQ
jgi:hypothetical protein